MIVIVGPMAVVLGSVRTFEDDPIQRGSSLR
jgi:hypothetical protein